MPLIALFPRQWLAELWSPPTNHLMAWGGRGGVVALCPPRTLPSKAVHRHRTAVFRCPVVCLDVFKELFKVE